MNLNSLEMTTGSRKAPPYGNGPALHKRRRNAGAQDAITRTRNCPRCLQDFTALRGSDPRSCPTCKKKPSVRLPAMVNTPLSRREKQIVDLVAKAKRNKEIAYELHLTENTVKLYISTIYDKTGVDGRCELILWALRNPPQLSQSTEEAANQKGDNT